MTHPDSPKFLAILERVPRWHMLTPRVDVWREKDELCDRNGWWAINSAALGKKIALDNPPYSGRRPIPEHVRRSEAWWALYNQLATVAPESLESPAKFIVYSDRLTIDYFEPESLGGLRGFSFAWQAQAAIPILGGEAEIIKNLQEGPGAYMRWVLGERQ